MNQTTHEDFGLFRMELLNVDYITFNLTILFESAIEELATYFQNLGFNSFLKAKETSKARQEVFLDYKNYHKNVFELEFILAVPYQKHIIQIQFPGASANRFYELVKQGSIERLKRGPANHKAFLTSEGKKSSKPRKEILSFCF